MNVRQTIFPARLAGTAWMLLLLSGCGAGVAKQESFDAFYTRYDYLVGRDFATAKAGFAVEPLPVEISSDTRVPEGVTLYEIDTSFDYAGYELSKQRATELRANQAVVAGGGPGAAAVADDIVAKPSELNRVNKTELCKLRFFVDENGSIVRVDQLGNSYTINFIEPVPTECTKRLDQLVARPGG